MNEVSHSNWMNYWAISIGANRLLNDFMDRSIFMSHEGTLAYDYDHSYQFKWALDTDWNDGETYEIKIEDGIDSGFISEVIVSQSYMTLHEMIERKD